MYAESKPVSSFPKMVANSNDDHSSSLRQRARAIVARETQEKPSESRADHVSIFLILCGRAPEPFIHKVC